MTPLSDYQYSVRLDRSYELRGWGRTRQFAAPNTQAAPAAMSRPDRDVKLMEKH